MQNRPTIFINPTQLTPDHSKILINFFKAQQRENNFVYFSGTDYPITQTHESVTGVKSHFCLTHTITSYRKKRTLTKPNPINHPFSYSILSQHRAGEGGFGQIYLEVGTLVNKDGKLFFKQNKKRINKAQTRNDPRHRPAELFKIWENESNLLCLLPEYHAKQIIYSKDRTWSFIIMRKFDKNELFTLLNDDINQRKPLSTEIRLKLSVNLLRALKELHEQNIVHRDIKPENFIIDEDIKAHIIDFGLSRKLDQEDHKHDIGSLEYITPEAIPSKSAIYATIDEKSDIYSLGLILRLMWGGYIREFKKESPHYPFPEFDSLFKNIKTDLTETQQMLIKNMLIRMTSKMKGFRPSLTEVISLFDRMAFQHRAAKQPLSAAIALNEAHEEALRSYEVLKKLEISESKNCINDLKLALHKMIDAVQDNPLILAEFIETLGVKAFKGLSTANDCHKTVDQIIDNFLNYSGQLISLYKTTEMIGNEFSTKQDEVNALRFMQLNEEIEYTLNKRHDRKVNLDDLAELNNRYANKIPLLQNSFDELEQLFKITIKPVLLNPDQVNQQLLSTGIGFFKPVCPRSSAPENDFSESFDFNFCNLL